MRVAVMRPKDYLPRSGEIARELGMDSVCASPVSVLERDSEEFSEFLEALRSGGVDTLVFTSASGVKVSLDLASRRGMREDMVHLLAEVDIISIGPHTSTPLEKEGLRVAFMPGEYSCAGILASVPGSLVEGRRVWVLRSDFGDQGLVSGLRNRGAEVWEVVVYRLERNLEGEDMISLVRAGARGEIDAFAFTSSLSARTFIEVARSVVGEEGTMAMLDRALVGAIGKPTMLALGDFGVRVDAVPSEADFRELLESLLAVAKW